MLEKKLYIAQKKTREKRPFCFFWSLAARVGLGRLGSVCQLWSAWVEGGSWVGRELAMLCQEEVKLQIVFEACEGLGVSDR